MGRDPTTLDWVEQAGGDPYRHACEEEGHDWEVVGVLRRVVSAPAAHMRCRRCGEKTFSWVPARALERET